MDVSRNKPLQKSSTTVVKGPPTHVLSPLESTSFLHKLDNSKGHRKRSGVDAPVPSDSKRHKSSNVIHISNRSISEQLEDSGSDEGELLRLGSVVSIQGPAHQYVSHAPAVAQNMSVAQNTSSQKDGTLSDINTVDTDIDMAILRGPYVNAKWPAGDGTYVPPASPATDDDAYSDISTCSGDLQVIAIGLADDERNNRVENNQQEGVDDRKNRQRLPKGPAAMALEEVQHSLAPGHELMDPMCDLCTEQGMAYCVTAPREKKVPKPYPCERCVKKKKGCTWGGKSTRGVQKGGLVHKLHKKQMKRKESDSHSVADPSAIECERADGQSPFTAPSEDPHVESRRISPTSTPQHHSNAPATETAEHHWTVALTDMIHELITTLKEVDQNTERRHLECMNQQSEISNTHTELSNSLAVTMRSLQATIAKADNGSESDNDSEPSSSSDHES